jgi:hypothetical protein
VPTITITIDIPDGSSVQFGGSSPAASTGSSPTPNEIVDRYWNDYLSDNGRRLYAAAARAELAAEDDAFTLENVAEQMGVEYATAQSIHRTAGRGARVWREETGLEPVIRLDNEDYRYDAAHEGMRSTYRLPEGIADQIVHLANGDEER